MGVADLSLIWKESGTNPEDKTELFKIDRLKTIEITYLIILGVFANRMADRILIIIFIIAIGFNLGRLRGKDID